MSRLGTLAASVFVKVRVIIVLAWTAGAIVAVLQLPSNSGSSSGSLGTLVPKNAPALKAEDVSARRFGFPLLSRTIVVVRDPAGLPRRRQAGLTSLAERLTLGQVPGFAGIAGAAPIVNSLGKAPFSREHGTTALLYLYFRPAVTAATRVQLAQRLLDVEVGSRPGEFEGVTGAVPARVARSELINGHLAWVELATIVLVALAIAIHFRAPGAALLTLGAIAIAYDFSDRLVAAFGRLAGVEVPAEIQPVLVVLVFGVVTDYSIFFLSRYRALLRAGDDRLTAARRVVRRITPIVAVAGLTVAAGTAALVVASLGFLRAFGPGLAIAVIVAMLVATSFVPAVLAIAGRHMFWPRLSERDVGMRRLRKSTERVRTVQLAVRHPIVAALLAIFVVGGAASGLSRIALGNEFVAGLPSGSSPQRAYSEAKMGFTPGVLAPAVVMVSGSGIGDERQALERLQASLSVQPGVAQVLGVTQQQLPHMFAVVFAPSGNAVRYVLFMNSDPLSARAINQIRALQSRLPSLLRRSGLRNAVGIVAGDTALSGNTVDSTLSDLARVTPTILVVTFAVMAIFLRALIAPLYLVLTSALATLAALGLTVYTMQMLLGYGQITFYVIFVVAVLLISLGSDYNVFLVGRVWQETRARAMRDAVEVAGSTAARPITTAALVLALSFALLAIVPIRGFREVAFAVAIGLLIDGFVIRTALVPALLALLGPLSLWPRRGRKAPQHSTEPVARAG